MSRPAKPRVTVTWEDARFDHELVRAPSVRTWTTGYLVKDTKKAVKVAASWSHMEGYAQVTTIPRPMVVGIEAIDSTKEDEE